jgi:hypothetical protein
LNWMFLKGKPQKQKARLAPGPRFITCFQERTFCVARFDSMNRTGSGTSHSVVKEQASCPAGRHQGQLGIVASKPLLSRQTQSAFPAGEERVVRSPARFPGCSRLHKSVSD